MNENIDNYLKDVVAYGQVQSPAMLIIVKFLLDTGFSH